MLYFKKLISQNNSIIFENLKSNILDGYDNEFWLRVLLNQKMMNDLIQFYDVKKNLYFSQTGKQLHIFSKTGSRALYVGEKPNLIKIQDIEEQLILRIFGSLEDIERIIIEAPIYANMSCYYVHEISKISGILGFYCNAYLYDQQQPRQCFKLQSFINIKINANKYTK